MIRPLPWGSMCLAACCARSKAAIRWTSISSRQAAIGYSSGGWRVPEPALFTRMSIRPKYAATRSTSPTRCAGSARSACMPRNRRPSASTRPRVCRSSPESETQAMSAPASARPRAIACPRPRLAPVTSATRPSRANCCRIMCDLKNWWAAPCGTGARRNHSRSGEHEFVLPRREELASGGGDQHVLLQPDQPGRGRHPQFQGEHVARLDHALRVAAVARPPRPEHRAPVVNRPPQPVSQPVLELRVTGLHHYPPGGRVHLEPARTRSENCGARADGPHHHVEGSPHVVRRTRFTRPTDVPHPLEVRAVPVEPHA